MVVISVRRVVISVRRVVMMTLVVMFARADDEGDGDDVCEGG